jgi:hypothetical protein
MEVDNKQDTEEDSSHVVVSHPSDNSNAHAPPTTPSGGLVVDVTQGGDALDDVDVMAVDEAESVNGDAEERPMVAQEEDTVDVAAGAAPVAASRAAAAAAACTVSVAHASDADTSTADRHSMASVVEVSSLSTHASALLQPVATLAGAVDAPPPGLVSASQACVEPTDEFTVGAVEHDNVIVSAAAATTTTTTITTGAVTATLNGAEVATLNGRVEAAIGNNASVVGVHEGTSHSTAAGAPVVHTREVAHAAGVVPVVSVPSKAATHPSVVGDGRTSHSNGIIAVASDSKATTVVARDATPEAHFDAL